MSGGAPVAVDWFGTPPERAGRGHADSLAAALWRLDRDAPSEFRADPIPGTHMICAHLSGSIDWQAQVEDRRYARPCLPGTFNMLRAGEGCDVAFRDAHASFIHFYLPTRWLDDRLDEHAPNGAPGALELRDPMNGRCPEVGRHALSAARALRDGGLAAKLEIEAAGLSLAAALIRRHSNAVCRPPARAAFRRDGSGA